MSRDPTSRGPGVGVVLGGVAVPHTRRPRPSAIGRPPCQVRVVDTLSAWHPRCEVSTAEEAHMNPTLVVVPLDGSSLAEGALAAAVGFAKAGAKLVLLRAVEAHGTPF